MGELASLSNRRTSRQRLASRLTWALAVATLLLAACGSNDQPRRVGILDFLGSDDLIEGFKSELAEHGFVEGVSVVYIIEATAGDLGGLAPAAKRLIEADVELIFAITTPAAIEAKRLAAPLGVPVIFAPVTDPVGSELVDSLRAPGGFATGVKTGGAQPKLLEWFQQLDQDGQTVLFVPHQPDDDASVQGLIALRAASESLGIELVIQEVSSAAEITDGIAAARADIDGIHVLPSGFIVQQIEALVAAGNARGWPVIGPLLVLERGGVLAFGPAIDQGTGEQVGHLAAKVLEGTPIAELPVETTSFQLGVNLVAARDIGVELPDDLIALADVVVRE